MGSLTCRIARLEDASQGGTSPPECQRAVARNVLRRLSDEDLDAYEVAVERPAAGETPTEEDQAIVGRVEAIRGEFYRELDA